MRRAFAIALGLAATGCRGVLGIDDGHPLDDTDAPVVDGSSADAAGLDGLARDSGAPETTVADGREDTTAVDSHADATPVDVTSDVSPVDTAPGCPAKCAPTGGPCECVYTIDNALMDAPTGCGTDDRVNACTSFTIGFDTGSTPYGFHWNDVGAGVVKRIAVVINEGPSCLASEESRTVTVNGKTAGTFMMQASACGCPAPKTRIATVDPVASIALSTYAVGARNALSVTNAKNCEGLKAVGGAFARVTVTYE